MKFMLHNYIVNPAIKGMIVVSSRKILKISFEKMKPKIKNMEFYVLFFKFFILHFNFIN